jgi:hypothetical protein
MRVLSRSVGWSSLTCSTTMLYAYDGGLLVGLSAVTLDGAKHEIDLGWAVVE